MAIHIRHRREALRRLRQRLVTVSLAAALACILSVGTVLFCMTELHREPLTSFTAVPYLPEGGDSPAEQEDASSTSASSAADTADTTPDFLLADADEPTLPDEIAALDDSALGSEESTGDATGDAAAQAVGSGGQGKGKGGKGNKHGPGLNNDIQIVLALDASGSMDYLFREVESSMQRMVRTLCESRINGHKASVNVGVLAYGSARNNGAPRKVCDFTTDVNILRRNISRVTCDGSNEYCGTAIAYADSAFAWNRREGNRALKILIIAGNEPFDQGAVDYRAAIASLRESGIILNTIHCGRRDEECAQWQEAARLGGGVYLELDRNTGKTDAERRVAAADYGAALRRWVEMPVLPLGSPHEQEMRRKQHRALRDSLPPTNAAMSAWKEENAPHLLQEGAWDAAELCRRLGAETSLATLGGRGNLPPELRSLPEEELIARLRAAATERADLLREVQRREAETDDLCPKILRAVRHQARALGIDMRL